MKNIRSKIISKIAFALMFIVVASCVPDEYGSTFNYKPFVQITTTAVKVSENDASGQATVTLQYVGAALPQDLTVNLSVTLDGVQGSVEQPSTSVVIKAGEFTGTDVIAFTNNTVNDGNKVVNIHLVSTSSDAVGIATPGTNRDKGTVTIVDDDCPFNIDDFVGTYTLDMELAAAFVYPEAGDYPDNTIVLSKGDDENTLVDPDFMLLSYNFPDNFDAVPVTIKLDPASLSASIVGDHFDFLNGSSTDNGVVAYNSAPNRRVFTNGDEPGDLSICAKSFTINATITREDGSVGQVMTFTYVKQ